MNIEKSLGLIIILLTIIAFMLFLQTQYMLSDDTEYEETTNINFVSSRFHHLHISHS